MLEFRYLKYLLILAVLPLVLSCEKEQPSDGRVVLAQVGTSRLYKDEVDLLLASVGHSEDSALFVQEYLERWAMEELYYSMASHNVASNEEIEKMVDSYRKSLILNIYQNNLINQHLKSAVSEEDIKSFYEANEVLFDAEENMVRGLLLVLPAKSPKISKVRKWCAGKSPEDLEELEKYSAEHAVVYDYFVDVWCSFEDVVKRTPLTEEQLLERLARKKMIEFRDKDKLYFVCADSIIRKGDRMPMELVSSDINELIVNSRKAEFIKKKKQELYNDARNSGRIRFFNQDPLKDDN